MNPQVALISKSQIEFGTLLKLGQELLGRSLSKGLDESGLDVKELSGFIALLDEFMSEGSNPLVSLRDAGDLLKHLQFAFLIVMTQQTYVELLEVTGLGFSTTETVRQGIVCSIVSGNLQQWRNAIINSSTGRESYYARIAMNAVMRLMEKSGLAALWSNYTKDLMVDKTVRLIPGA